MKEVTYYDEQRSHWVAQVGGNQQWDAVNEDWIPQQQIGWRSINGLENSGRVKFTPMGNERTNIDVFLSYTPPVGVLGAVVDKLGFDSHFDSVLQDDLNRFAAMVEAAPTDALDPMQSHYLFYNDSAYARNTVTERQKEAMAHDPMMQAEALQQRDATIHQQSTQANLSEQNRRSEEDRIAQQQQQAIEQHRTKLARQAELDREAARQQQAEQPINPQETILDPVYNTLGGRNASVSRTAFGDQDSRTERFPGHGQDPMTSRVPRTDGPDGKTTSVADTKIDSPWRNTIRGASEQEPENDETNTSSSPVQQQ